jgi:hypothetical protein
MAPHFMQQDSIQQNGEPEADETGGFCRGARANSGPAIRMVADRFGQFDRQFAEIGRFKVKDCSRLRTAESV